MTPEDAMQLLARIALVDGRSFTAAHAVAWADLLRLDDGTPITLADAVVAANEHHRTSTYPIKPADIVQAVRALRRARVGDDPIPLPPVDPSDTAAYIGWTKAWTRHRAAGVTREEAEDYADAELGIRRSPQLVARRDLALPDMPRPE